MSAKVIAELNDRFRHEITMKGGSQLEEMTLMRSVADRGFEAVILIVRAISRFDTFTRDNDPWGEHDFGVVEVDGIGRFNLNVTEIGEW